MALPVRVPLVLRRRYGSRISGKLAPFVAVLIITVVLVALGQAMNRMSYIIWGGFWVAPLLFLIALPVVERARRLDGDSIGRIVLAGAVIKIVVSPLLRYWMVYGLYGGVADASRYHSQGELLAPLFRHGIYRDLGKISGTRFIDILTGQVYAVTGPTRLGGFMVFSFFAFIGCYLFFRAFRTAYPEGNGRRYAQLLFFFPTLLFWPSSIGKESFMMLVLGAAAYGAAQLLTGRIRGLPWLALGIWGALIVRPHMALIIAGGLMVATPLALLKGTAHGHRRRRGRLSGAVLLVAMLLAGPILVGAAEKFFGLESLNAETAQQQLEEVTRRSGQGGSAYTASTPTDPVGFAIAAITVLFRPFPFEAGSVQGMISAAEGMALLAFCGLSVRRLARIPVEAFRRPYVAFALIYTFAFIFAFSSIENFGILARQRSQLLPVLLVLLCVNRRDPADIGAAAIEGEPETVSG